MKLSDETRWLKKVLACESGYEYEAVDRYANRLVRLAQTKLPNNLRARVDAADVVQSALLSFFTRNQAGGFEFDEAKDIWRLLAAITYRKIQKSIRFHHRQQRDDSREKNRIADLSGELDSPTVSSIISLNESLDLISSRLPSKHQAVLQLRLEGFSIVEIAKQLDVSTRTVNRGLAMIQEVALEMLGLE